MATLGSISLVMVTLALADLTSACLPPIFDNSRFKIYNEVEGFDAEGFVIWSPINCSHFVQSYGTYKVAVPIPTGPIGPIPALPPLGTVNIGPTAIRPPSPYHILPPACSGLIALNFVSAKIVNSAETIQCEAYIEEDPSLSTYHCHLRVTAHNDTGTRTCKVEKHASNSC